MEQRDPCQIRGIATRHGCCPRSQKPRRVAARPSGCELSERQIGILQAWGVEEIDIEARPSACSAACCAAKLSPRRQSPSACAWCKKVRNDRGYWYQIEKYITANSATKITRGICPDCEEKFLKVKE